MKRMRMIIAAMLTVFLLMGTAVSAAAHESGTEYLGTVESMLSQIGCLYEECDLGTATASAIRSAAGTDFAAVSAGLLYQNLPGGTVTEADVSACYTQDDSVYICTVTAADLKEVLEIGVSHIVVESDETVNEEASGWEGFLQLSGLTVKCDYSAAAGDRIIWIEDADGARLDISDDTTVYTMAVTGSVLSEEYGYSFREEELYADSMIGIVCEAVTAGTMMSDETPYKIIGVQGTILMQTVSPLIPILLLAMFLIVGAMSVFRTRSAEKRWDSAEMNDML